jgi:hypothetical protein
MVNKDPNKQAITNIKRFCEQHHVGLITSTELVNCIGNEVACIEEIIYAVGPSTEREGNRLTYGVIKVIDRPGDLAIEISSRCGDKVRIDKNAILTFKEAIVEAIAILEKRYPTVCGKNEL